MTLKERVYGTILIRLIDDLQITNFEVLLFGRKILLALAAFLATITTRSFMIVKIGIFAEIKHQLAIIILGYQ
jgi:hypothetical protein